MFVKSGLSLTERLRACSRQINVVVYNSWIE